MPSRQRLGTYLQRSGVGQDAGVGAVLRSVVGRIEVIDVAIPVVMHVVVEANPICTGSEGLTSPP